MMSRLAFIVSLWGLASAHAADADAEQYVGLESAGVQVAPQRHAALTLPLEDVLARFAKTANISFIFDSRLIRGKSVLPVDETRPTETALRASLLTANLELHKVSATTYAITAQAAPPAPPVASIPNAAAATPVGIVDTIVVTATAATAIADAGSRNLFVFDRDALDYLAIVNPAEAVYELPQSLASVSAANTTFLGAAAGLNFADLRGFGSQRTMVLTNGRRRTLTPAGNDSLTGFDISTLGEPFFERIEVSNRFGGAQLGPEAVAGAINFVTRSNLDGFEVGGLYGISERGDAEEFSVHGLGGVSIANGAGRLNFGLNHSEENGLLGADREVTAVPYGFATNGRSGYSENAEFLPGFGGSSATPDGYFSGIVTEDGVFIPPNAILETTYLDGAGGFEPFLFTLDQLFNWAEQSHSIVPLDRTIGFLDMSIDVSPKVSIFAEAHLGLARSNSSIAAVPATTFQGVDPLTGDGTPIPLNDPTVPDDLRVAVSDQLGVTEGSVIISRRFEEVGLRERQNNRRFNEMIVGADIRLNSSVNLQTFYRFGHNTTRTTQLNRIDRDRLLLAADTVRCSNTPGCSPINLFQAGGVSREAADFIRAPGVSRKITIEEHEIAGLLNATVNPPLLNDADLSFGVSLRRTSLTDDNLAPDNIVVLGSFIESDFQGSTDLADISAAISAPLLDEASPVGSLEGSLSYRLTTSSRFGTAHNFESNLTWRPIESVTLFGGYNQGERHPNIIEQFSVGLGAERGFTDPCATGDEAFAANCNSDHPLGVSEGFFQSKALATVTTFGNPDLEPEKVTHSVIGFSIQPSEWTSSFPGQFELSASWLNYRVDNLIGSYFGSVQDCFSSPQFSSPACGINPLNGDPLIRRDPVTEQIVYINTVAQNDGTFRWRGLDLEARYAVDPSDLGPIDQIWLSGLHTYTQKAEQMSDAGDVTDLRGLANNPRHKTLLAVGVNAGPVGLSALAHRRGRAESVRSDIPETKIPAVTTFDLSAKIDISDRTVATLAIENITDREPPLVAFSRQMNTFPQHYDIIGRRFSVGVKASF